MPGYRAVFVVPGEIEAHQLCRRAVATQRQDERHAIADTRIGRGEERGAAADAYRDDDGRAFGRGHRGDHGLHVVRPQPAAREAGDGRQRHDEPRAGEQPRGPTRARIVLSFSGGAVHENERRWGTDRPRRERIGGAGAQQTRTLDGRLRQRRQRGPSVVRELGEEGGRDGGALNAVNDRGRENEREKESAEPGYFRLTHFTRRHPLNMLTLATSSGVRPTASSSGVIVRFDFQPSRVQIGATKSSRWPVRRRSLRKWFRMTMMPPGFTTRRIS